MLLSIIIAFTVVSTILEIGIAHSWKRYRMWASNNILVNLLGSMALSACIGIVYGTTGLVLAVASVASTICTIPYYQGMAYIDRNPDIFSRMGDKIKGRRDRLLRTLNTSWRVMTFPFWGTRWIMAFSREFVHQLHTPNS